MRCAKNLRPSFEKAEWPRAKSQGLTFSGLFTLTYASGTDWVSSVTNGGSYTRATPLLSASGGKFNALASVTTKWGTKTLGLFTAQYDTTRGWRTGQGELKDVTS